MNLFSTIQLYAGGPGSGCNPEKGKCGRTVTMYHGTIEDFLPSIKQHGLDPAKHARGVRGVYVTGNKGVARYYAKSGAMVSDKVHQHPSRGVVLTLNLPERFAKSLHKDDSDASAHKAFFTTRRIPAKYIKRVEKLPGFGMPKDIWNGAQ
jgi:RNA:NAD 2'-phosphotransferase (TPT1/KptA family)